MHIAELLVGLVERGKALHRTYNSLIRLSSLPHGRSILIRVAVKLGMICKQLLA